MMTYFTYNCFVRFTVIVFLVLISYGVLGIVLKSMILEKSTFHGIWPLNEKCGIVVLLLVQIILLVVAAIGIAGIVCRSLLIWYIPGFLLLAVGVTLIALGGVTLRESSRDYTHDILSAVVAASKVNGIVAAESVDWISNVQWEYNCCGILSYKDYLQFNFSNLPNESVPKTCCQRNYKIPPTNCGVGILKPEKTLEEIESVLIRVGCGKIMSKLHGVTLHWLGMEMCIVGFLSLAIAGIIYTGIFTIVSPELTQLDEVEEQSGGEEGGTPSQTTVSSTTVANTCMNTSPGVLRNPTNNRRRRIFRTRRHGGGESIVSFAVDLENNNLSDGPSSSPAHHGHQVGKAGHVHQGQGQVKGRLPNRPSDLRNRMNFIPQGGSRQAKSKSAQITKNQRCLSHMPAKQAYINTAVAVEEDDFQNTMEMLLKPRDNNSIISTTPYPSSQNFLTYFRQHQDPPSRRLDSDTNVALDQPLTSRTPPTLTHYSSLPHVYSLPPPTATLVTKSPDQKSKAMAELNQRFPPGVSNCTKSPTRQAEVPLPVTSQTSHHHYYRIPLTVVATPLPGMTQPSVTMLTASAVPTFIDGKFPSVACVTNLEPIQEEGESGRSTLVRQDETQRVSIFEIFSHVIENSTNELNLVRPHTEDDEESPTVEESSMSEGRETPYILNLQSDEDESGGEGSAGCLIINEHVEGLQEPIQSLKVNLEPIEALVYFQL